MTPEEIEFLIIIKEKLKQETEDYVSHDKMTDKYEKYLLIIALEKFLETI